MELPDDPDNLNSDRAEWAGDAIAAFMQATGTEPEKALPDLLCDLMHWANRHHETGFESALELARWQYDQETRVIKLRLRKISDPADLIGLPQPE